MLNFPGSLKVFIAVEACDMRRSFNGLHDAVTHRLGGEPRSGAVFVFINRSRNLIKLLHWDGTGLWIPAKRLEKGTCSWPLPADAQAGKLRLNTTALALLLDGIDMRDGCRRPWYQLDG